MFGGVPVHDSAVSQKVLSDTLFEYTVLHNDTLSFTLYEKRDSSKHTLWYRSHIVTRVCRENLCEIAAITFYWDEVGNFMKFTLPENRNLTKYDHV